MYKSLSDSHLEDLNRINKQQDFCLHDLDNKIIDGVIEEDNKVVAYGIVKRQAEAIILLDKSKNRLSRARALKELMQVALFGAKKEKCQQLYCFISDPLVSDLLQKHYGFIETKDVVLVLNLEN